MTIRVWEAEKRAPLGGAVIEVGWSQKSCFGFYRSGQSWNLAKRSKGARRMPRRGPARKDVASCEKPWGAARRL